MLSNHEDHDAVGDNIIAKEGSWVFSGDVPKKFLEHIKRSVPYYNEGHDLICKLSEFFIKDNTICYDLGCSTAALTGKLAKHHALLHHALFVGIDVEQNMIEQARKDVASQASIELIVDNIATHPYKRSDLMVAYYTLQFIPPRFRQDVINAIYAALTPGGGFIVFEKIKDPDEKIQDMMEKLYVDFKLSQNFTPAQIAAKARSLKGVLQPLSCAENLNMLKKAGFAHTATIFKHICFEGYLAIK